MSATISDDSAIVRTFDAQPNAIAKPITSDSLAGVSERMILVPEWMNFNKDNIPKNLRELAKLVTEKHQVGIVILVPSDADAQEWKDMVTLADSTEKVTELVKKLQEGKIQHPVVFANRLLLGELCEAVVSDNELIIRCEQLLSNSTLKPQSLVEHYLVPFVESD